MLSREDYMIIEDMRKRGMYQKDIAEELGVHPRTVARALELGKAPSVRTQNTPMRVSFVHLSILEV